MRPKHPGTTWGKMLFKAGQYPFFGKIRREERRRSRYKYNQFYRDLARHHSSFDLDSDGEKCYHLEQVDEPGEIIPFTTKNDRYDPVRDDYLAPLRGFLRSNVGRPWTEIYGKIVRRTNRNSVTGDHLFLHLEGYVETDPRWIERVQSQFVIGRSYSHSYYVDEDGLLQHLMPLVDPPDGYNKNGKEKFQIRTKEAKEWAGVEICERPTFSWKWRLPTMEIMLRKVIVQGTKLYWGHREERFRQSRELSKEEYSFYHRCDKWAKEAITHKPE